MHSSLSCSSAVGLLTLSHYPCYSIILCSPEAKQIVEDGLSDMAASLLAAYDSGELITALQEGPTGWQKWVKALGKAIKRKVNFPHCCTKKLSSYSSPLCFFLTGNCIYGRERAFSCPFECC